MTKLKEKIVRWCQSAAKIFGIGQGQLKRDVVTKKHGIDRQLRTCWLSMQQRKDKNGDGTQSVVFLDSDE